MKAPAKFSSSRPRRLPRRHATGGLVRGCLPASRERVRANLGNCADLPGELCHKKSEAVGTHCWQQRNRTDTKPRSGDAVVTKWGPNGKNGHKPVQGADTLYTLVITGDLLIFYDQCKLLQKPHLPFTQVYVADFRHNQSQAALAVLAVEVGCGQKNCASTWPVRSIPPCKDLGRTAAVLRSGLPFSRGTEKSKDRGLTVVMHSC